MLWIENGAARIESESALKLASYVGGWCKLALAACIIPRGLRNWAYRRFARNRHRISGKQTNVFRPPRSRDRDFWISEETSSCRTDFYFPSVIERFLIV